MPSAPLQQPGLLKFSETTTTGQMPSTLPSQLNLPNFETNAEDVLKNGREMIAYSKARVSEICQLDPADVTFSECLGALDDLVFIESMVVLRIHLLQNAHPDRALREAARNVQIEYQTWSIERDYLEELYKVILSYEQKKEELSGEDKKLLKETLRDYRRRGMSLPAEKRHKIQKWNQALSEMETRFSTAINEHQAELLVDESDLLGLDRDFIETLEKKGSQRVVTLDYPQFRPIMEFAQKESVRRKLMSLKYKTADNQNTPLLDEIISLRHKIAKELGYASWNDYVIESRMAKKAERVFEFLDEVEAKLRVESSQDLAALKEIKAGLDHQETDEVQIWDFYFLSSRQKKEKFQVDSKALREFFALDRVLDGLFEIAGRIFQIKIEEENSENFQAWHEDVRLLKISDQNGDALGYCYLDLHPREGKYGHAAAFSLIEGKYRPDGVYQRPVAAMICNFSKASGNAPALIPHEEVETLFHEFGHILHNLLTRAKYVRFSGTNVAWDFVEAPSQILENWVWDFESLQLLAKHYKDPSKSLSREQVEKMNKAKKAGASLFYLRQVSLAKADLELHKGQQLENCTELVNHILGKVFLPLPEGSAFAAGWGHLMGYDSGYYGYAWADVMAADLFSKFQENGIFDPETGLRLRKEIYEPGGGRDENTSLEAFLGRPLSSRAFFEELRRA